MKKIFKFDLELTDSQIVDIPLRSKILSAQLQRGKLRLWALVNPSERFLPTTVYVIGTGNPTPDDIDECEFIGTIQLAEGKLIFHVFIKPIITV